MPKRPRKSSASPVPPRRTSPRLPGADARAEARAAIRFGGGRPAAPTPDPPTPNPMVARVRTRLAELAERATTRDAARELNQLLTDALLLVIDETAPGWSDPSGEGPVVLPPAPFANRCAMAEGLLTDAAQRFPESLPRETGNRAVARAVALVEVLFWQATVFAPVIGDTRPWLTQVLTACWTGLAESLPAERRPRGPMPAHLFPAVFAAGTSQMGALIFVAELTGWPGGVESLRRATVARYPTPELRAIRQEGAQLGAEVRQAFPPPHPPITQDTPIR